ncbi:hypothetical protein [Bosea sp. PAMC 26642]|uniref:hypothetical protein n=1 Tax=Bosea sp. (strain PAMC 26642) TaxID=1792307 RepID=UPI00077062E0|nr:hypothetical protein [Bosea sp. PAMC 26642]AMJ59935.1 hypothetical protein AXW83_06170 [Bosea sp. PAMC 26642]
MGDVETIVSSIAEDITVFDMFGLLHSGGKASVREGTTGWLVLYEAPPRWEDRDVTVAASGAVAFTHSLGHSPASARMALMSKYGSDDAGVPRRRRQMAHRPLASL